MTSQAAYIWAFLAACGSLGLSLGIAVSYWPWRPVVYPMGHPVYFKRGLDLLGYYRRDETIRIGLFVWAAASALVSLILIAIALIKIIP